jgi:hypothetical protein
MAKTITRLFDNYTDAKSAIRDLEHLGVPQNDLSIVANNSDGTHSDHGRDGLSDVNDHGDVSRGTSTGAVLGGVGGLLAGLACSRSPVLARSSRPAGWLRLPSVPASAPPVALRPEASSARSRTPGIRTRKHTSTPKGSVVVARWSARALLIAWFPKPRPFFSGTSRWTPPPAARRTANRGGVRSTTRRQPTAPTRSPLSVTGTQPG